MEAACDVGMVDHWKELEVRATGPVAVLETTRSDHGNESNGKREPTASPRSTLIIAFILMGPAIVPDYGD